MDRPRNPLDALRLGWSIFPCKLNKKPLIKWKKYQTEFPTEEQVLEWMERLQPASWALATGKLSNRVVLDFDGERGARTRELLALPAPHRRSPRGGHHVDVAWPGYRIKTLTCENDAALMERCPGMDVRGDGGFCIIMGRSAVGEYEWLLDTADTYELDPATWEKIQPPKPKKVGVKPVPVADKTNGRVDVELLVRQALSKVAGGMGRNNAGTWLMIQLRDNQFTREEALAIAFSERCPPVDGHGDESPYTLEEWAATLDSIYSQPAREPWSEPTSPSLLLPALVILPPSGEIPFPGVTQAAAPVDLADLLTKICAFTLKFVCMSDAQHTVNALWVAHTHVLEAADYTPYIHVHSPVKRSGKTRLLEVNELLVHEALLTGGLTRSSLVRAVDSRRPAILLDEIDRALTEGELAAGICGVLNTGFARSGRYLMSVPNGNSWVDKYFSTFSPKMFAGIGQKLDPTVRDRSIRFLLKRRLRVEKIERFRPRKVRPAAEILRQGLIAWSRAYGGTLIGVEPDLPDELNDRCWDIIEPLLVIADKAGGKWPAKARAALIELCGEESVGDTEISVRLLADIKLIFGTEDQMQTEVLLGSLMALSESPWREYGRNGAPITARQLAELLEDFGPCPRRIHEGVGADRRTLRGYVKSEFLDAWERYPLPEKEEDKPEPVPAPPAYSGIYPPQAPQPAVYAGFSDFSYPPQNPRGADEKSEESPINMRGGAHGADKTPDMRAAPDFQKEEPWLTPEEIAKYTSRNFGQKADTSTECPKGSSPDRDFLEEEEEADR